MKKKTETFEKKLYKRFPDLFGQRHLPMSMSCMCWGLDIQSGWYKLLEEACVKFEALKKMGIWVEFRQIKQKFATLRMYHDSYAVKNVFIYRYWRRFYMWLNRLTFGTVALKSRTTCSKFWNILWHILFAIVNFIDWNINKLFTKAVAPEILDITNDIEWATESQSSITCEVCGKYGQRRKGGWIECLCDEHAKEKEVDDEETDYL